MTKNTTEFIQLTDLWSDGEYNELGHIMREESWGIAQVAGFCAYFAKHLGLNQLNILYKSL